MPRRHNVFYGSSYDRGLSNLLFIWSDVLKEIPDAQLHLCYGWDLFVRAYKNNAERMKWKTEVDALMNQKGITHHGRVGKDELKRIRKHCGIWAYPTKFTEINCITALECQSDGVVPVVTNVAALKETVGSGIKIDGDINTPEVIDEFKDELIKLMKDAKRWNEESQKARSFAKKYTWKKIAPKWTTEFATKTADPKVSVITPTNRTGWWNIMSFNLASQSYPIHEWIIIDDYKDRQPKNAVRMREKYGLNIVYTKTPKDYKYKHSLSKANNIGWENATGELLVWIQDFTLIPTHGIEVLVDIYRHNKDALIAPTDKHFSVVGKNDWDKPDAFNGELNILKEMVFNNPRNQYKGLRQSENPYDFELNYGAIPKAILDDLNGFYEIMDEKGVGYDNTEIAYRAMQAGYRLLVDDTNVASCIRHQDYLGEEDRGNANQETYEKIKTMPIRRKQ